MHLTLCQSVAKINKVKTTKSTSSCVKLKPNNQGSGFKKSPKFRWTMLNKNAKIKCMSHFENEYKDTHHVNRIKYSAFKNTLDINTTK